MILSDMSIAAFCGMEPPLISPYSEEQQQPASYDLTLDKLGERDLWQWTIYPGQFVLGSTYEHISIPNILQGKMDGKSSWARKGLIVHTAGFIDPGFQGQLVLEITNLSDKPVTVKKGERIAQISFQMLDRPAEFPYGSDGLGSHYQGQEGIVGSRM